MAYQDGTFTNAVQNGPAQIFYPFINAATKDNVTKGTIRNYVVLPSSYTPAAALSTDPADNTQYLITESDLTIEGGVARFSRTYSKVPQQQIEPGTIVLSKPTIPGNDAFPRNFGNYLIVQPDTTLEAFDSYKRANVTSDTGVPGFYPTGGTYTLTLDGNTTSAINYAANAATVQTAINGLTPVQNRGNVVVSGSYNSSGGLSVNFNNYGTATMNTASIVIASYGTLSSAVASSNGGYSQSFEIKNTSSSLLGVPPTINVANVTCTGTVSSAVLSSSGRTREFELSVYPTSAGQTLTGGSFTVTFDGATSGNINVSFDAATLKSNFENALNALSTVQDQGNVTVSGVTATTISQRATISFGSSIIKSGSFTVSLFSETTSAINYNSTIATVQSAINSLSNVQSRGNVVVTGGGPSNILQANSALASFSINFSNNSFTSNAVGLTPSGSTLTTVKNDGTIGKLQTLTFVSGTATRTLYAASHEIDAGENIFLRNAGSVFANVESSKVTVIDSNTIQLTVSSSDSWANVATFTEIGPRTKQGYQPGSVVIRSKTTTNFYLPGVTSGITTADDIAIPVDESGTAAFLQGVFSGQDNINVRVGELRPWQGPILMVDRTSVNADDV